jgi:hypothetical protein
LVKTQKTEPNQPDRLLVIACGMIAREVLAVKQQLKLDHLDLTCLPAEFHFYPDRIAPAMDKAIKKAKADGYEHIFVGYADCGTGGLLDEVLKEEGAERIEGPHCYQFYAGTAVFEKMMDEELGTFFLTDYLCRHFDRLIWKGFGLDRRPDMKDMVFGHYKKLVFLAQLEDPKLTAKAQEIAQRMGWAFEYRLTGYGELATFMANAAAKTH